MESQWRSAEVWLVHLYLVYGDSEGFLKISFQIGQLLPLTLQEIVGTVFVLQQIMSVAFYFHKHLNQLSYCEILNYNGVVWSW